MDAVLKRMGSQPLLGLVCLLVVWGGLALGHSLVVLLVAATGGVGLLDGTISWLMGFLGFVLVWIGMKRSETQGTILGYLGGNLIWCGSFEWSWRYFSHSLSIEPVMDGGFAILSGELLMIQATTLVVLSLLIFLGANKDTRCRMFMWFHRTFNLRPGSMTPGFQRQHARNTAMETVFLIWTIYLFAIYINDPRGIRYDSIAAMSITVGILVWGIWLVSQLLKQRGFGATFRYAIPTGNILWLPIEAFARWGLYPEIWIKPVEYSVVMAAVLLLFAGVLAMVYRSMDAASANAVAA
ncbi:MAG: hypothetical protein R3F27_01285 [Gammaproteobacteria bacterium]